MSNVSRELQYLNSHRQVEDLRRLRAAWEQFLSKEQALRRVPWVLRGGAGGLALVWLGLAVWLAGVATALAGLVLFAGGWVAAEWFFHARDPRSGRRPFGWELDRLNPQFEGAFSLLELIDAAEAPMRGRYMPVLEVTLSRVNWAVAAAQPDRRTDRRRAMGFLAGMGGAMVLALLSLWVLHIPTLAVAPVEPGNAARVMAAPAVGVSAHTPQIVDFRVRIEPPGYTHLPIQENFLTTIHAPSGAKVTIHWRIDCDGPAQTWLALGDRQLTQVVRGGPASAVLSSTQPAGAFAIIAQSGAAYTRLPLFLTWRDDQAPRVEATIAPKVERDREGVRFDLHSEDDYGLTKLECIISTQPNGAGATVRVEVFEIPLSTAQGDQDVFHGRVLIPGAVLDKLHQDRLRLQVKAYDTRTDEDGRAAPNVGVSAAQDFLVVQPWDNARKPRSLDHKTGGEGDQNNPSDSNTGGNGQGNGPRENDGPRMLQKNPDDPPGPEQHQPGSDSGPSKYSPLAGSQGDQPKPENETKTGPGKPPPKPDPNAPPSPQHPQSSDNTNDPHKDQTNPNSTGGASSTDGAKNPEPPPPATESDHPKEGAGADGNSENPAADPGNTPTPSTPNGAGAPEPPNATGNSSNPGGGGGNGHKENTRGTSQSNDTDAGAKGNAKVDTAVASRGGAVSVEDALNFARQKPLGAWQRNFGTSAVDDRVLQTDTGGPVAATAGGAPEHKSVTGAGPTATDRQAHLAAERVRIDQKYADLIEQYLMRVRTGNDPAAPMSKNK